MKYTVGDIVNVCNQKDDDSSISIFNNKVGKITEIMDTELYEYNIRVTFYNENMEEHNNCCFNENELELSDELIGYNFNTNDNENTEEDEPKKDLGELSDGYHTFNELYYHRTILFSLFVNYHPEISWKSHKHFDGSMYDGYFIVGVTTPEGDYSYHCKLEYWDMFKVPEVDHSPQWDGHKPEDITRLLSLSETLGNNQ